MNDLQSSYEPEMSVCSAKELVGKTIESGMPRGCEIIEVPAVEDERGALCFMEGEGHVPFKIARVFFLYDIPARASRGDHSHRTCAEVVFAVHGAFTMVVDDGCRRIAVRMDHPRLGILIPAGIWCKLTDFEEGTVCAVVASEKFDASGYTYSYEEYKEKVSSSL